MWCMGGKHDNKEWDTNCDVRSLAVWHITKGMTLRRLTLQIQECIVIFNP